jgi:2-polyprenyl-3-methyl-5-hydroxy-6-metoxy-1,4-benzoquinol methylase
MLLLQFVYFIVGKISTKFNIHKFKKIIDLEFIIIEKIIVKLHKLIPFYLDFYQEIVENEIRLADISKDDKILHIGSGPIPATSMLIAEKTKTHVTGIDKDFHFVKQALKCVSDQGFSENNQIIHADALDFPVDNFDLIIISQGVKPCNQILKNIAKNMKKDGRVIYRTTSSISGELTENDHYIKDLFTISKIIHQKKNGLLVSILLLKK